MERELESGQPASDRLTDEIGDLLFAVVNLARKAGVQPGPALDRANRKFRDRFEAVEALSAERGIDLDAAGLEVLDGLWDEVKEAECHPERSEGSSSQRPMLARRSLAALGMTDLRSDADYRWATGVQSRWICRGNAIASRMCGMPQIQATVRSMPSPNPECTNVPYRRRSRYQR